VDLTSAHLPLFGAVPFILLVVLMAVLPLFAARFWERRQHLIVIALSAVVLSGTALALGPSGAIAVVLRTIVVDYIPFILLLAALFVAAGGIVVRGNLRGTPVTNTAIFAVGMLLANFVGTTGASVTLIRPLLRANDDRAHNAHTVVFFIFLVSNIGGSLTPLGDPPLFLGYLHGVDFFWPLIHLAPLTLTVSILVLAVFFAVDLFLYRREGRLPNDPTPRSPLRVAGAWNIALIAVVAIVVAATGSSDLGGFRLLGVEITCVSLLRDVILLAVVAISMAWTPEALRRENGFQWAPLREVSILFLGIFITLIPVIAMLQAGLGGPLAPMLSLVIRGDGSLNNVALFWVTGALSSFVDNAPTYLVFFQLAGGSAPHLMSEAAPTLVAISAGAVYMGANSYIGNAPNLMVHAIACNQGVRMPSFFGYMAWSACVLIPVFLIVSMFLIGP